MDTPVTILQQRARAASQGPLARIRMRCVRLTLLTALTMAGCTVGTLPLPGRPVPGAPPSDVPDARAPRGPVLRVERPSAQRPPARAELTFLGTTDVHNRIYPYDYYTRLAVGYGLARLKPMIDSLRNARPAATYLFDSGDLLQGNPLGYVYARQHADQPNPVIEAMNRLGYSAAAIGNHEYNYGIPHLERAVAQARFPFLSGNTFKHGTREHAFTPYVLIPHIDSATRDTILIGVTGNTPPGVHVWDRANVEGKLEFRDVVTSLKPIVAELKQRGADVVVVLSHGGLEGTSYDTAVTGLPAENAGARLAREIPDIDVVFLGHTHEQVPDTTINGVLFTQAGMWAQTLAQADVQLERMAPGQWLVSKKSARLLRPDAQRADTAFLDSLRWQHERAVEYVKSAVGQSASRLNAAEGRTRDLPIVDFINEVQRKQAGADLAATAVFRLGASLPAGAITVADVAGLYIYDNTLKAVRITGAQLKAYLEKSAEYFRSWPLAAGQTLINPEHRGYNFDVVSGVDYTIDLTQPVGRRITRLVYRGQPVAHDQTFTIALNNYRQAGGGGFSMIAAAPVVYDRQEDVRELLLDEIKRKGTLRSVDYFQLNWRLLPEQAARAAQAELAAEATQPVTTTSAGKRLRVLGQNDFHGRLQPEVYNWSEGKAIGGAAVLYSYYQHERAGFDGPTITLDAGDVMQGTPISNLTQGRSTIDFFNLAGIDAAAIGNHDFDWTIPVLQQRMQQAKFPWLSANIYNAGAATRPAWARGSVMLERGGLKIGVIGLTTERTPTSTRADNVRGLEFRDGAAEINRLVPVLRSQGADFVIVTTHAGVTCDTSMNNCRDEVINWARRITAKPDLIVAGHTHGVVNTVQNGIPIVIGWDYSKKYSVIDLEKTADGRTRAWVRGQPTTFPDRVKADSGAAALVAEYERQIGPQVNRVVATLAAPLRKSGGEYALGHLIADAQRAASGAQVAVMNNGGIRTELDAGPLTWSDLYQLQPFGNLLVKLTLSGAQLHEVMEHILRGRQPGMHVSGITVWYDTLGAAGARVRRMQLLNGEEVTATGSYVVSVNDFMADGGDGLSMLPAARGRVDTGIVDLDALIEYLQKQPQPIQAPAEDRLRAGAGVRMQDVERHGTGRPGS
jgi:2',3'-cyclic-nucleotide 2'-phosphodiesterase/3'-nucleotidase/5'-nucleotidase